MHPIQACINNPVKVAVGVILLALFGLVAAVRMPMQLTPEVEIPTITVQTRWPGASPQEIEREIVREQEEQLQSVEGVTKMTSESRDSSGEITLEFLVGTNMEEALLKVNSRLSQVPEYPEDADEPVISTSSSSDRAIAWFVLSARLPSADKMRTFRDQQARDKPKLAEGINTAIAVREENPGLAELRLRRLLNDYPQVKEILPPDLDVPTLRDFAENMIEPQFERVPGVANSNVLGGRDRQMRVVVDPQKLAARGLTIADVRAVLRGENQDTSAGDFWEGKRRYVVRTKGQFRSEEQIEKLIITSGEGGSVYLRDVAEVKLGYTKPDGFARRYGTANIVMNCARETGANVLDVMQGLREVNQRLNDGLLAKHGLTLTQVYDETDYIYSAVGLVNQNIIVGGSLTVIVLMLFLHIGVRTLIVTPIVAITALAAVIVSPWFFLLTLAIIVVAGFWFARGALVVSLAIPISIIGTFLLLGSMGRSLNVISLAGLAFAVGMLVDNAVVVLENIFRHHQLGEPAFKAAYHGAKEVWGAVLASTLTTLAVFLPVVFIQEEAGQLFRDIALAISCSVAISLIISITVIPTATARLFSRRRSRESLSPAAGGGQTSSPSRIQLGDVEENGDNGTPARKQPRNQTPNQTPNQTGRSSSSPSRAEILRGSIDGVSTAAGRFVEWIVGLNAWLQQGPRGGVYRRLVLVVVLMSVALGGIYFLRPKVEYLPNGNRNLVICLIMPPPGYNLDELMNIGQAVEDKLAPYWDIDAKNLEAAKLDGPAIADFFYVARGQSVFLGLRAANQTEAPKLQDLVRRHLQNQFPGTLVTAFQTSLFGRGLTAGRNIDIEITGPELPKLVELGREVMGNFFPGADGTPPLLEPDLQPGIPQKTQARPIPSLDLSSPEVHVEPKIQQSADLGVNATDLGYAVNALIDGAFATDYYIGADKIDLVIVSSEAYDEHGQEQYNARTQDLLGMYIATPPQGSGGRHAVRLDTVADVKISAGPEQVNHRERQRAISIQVTPPPEVPLEEAIEKIRGQIIEPLRQRGALGGEYAINLSGTADKLDQTWNALSWNVLLALAITYLLMAALFESWVYPLVIILSVPLGAVGGILGLRALNVYLVNIRGDAPQTLDVLTMLGFVILIGTAVNNAILIVHQTLNLIRDQNLDRKQALLESVRTRVRPILMTTSTTILGLAPLVLFPGAGSELYRGLGSVVLGGLLMSTIFTLVLVPSLFSLMMELREYLARRLIGAPAAVGWDHSPVEEAV